MERSECIFCKIADGVIPSDKLYEDDSIIAFNDIQPVAPVHFLVIPKEHIISLNDIAGKDESLIGHMMAVAVKLAKEKGLKDDGYREIINCGKSAGQEVMHLHLHIIGGRNLDKMG